jgi:hypothetical protein
VVPVWVEVVLEFNLGYSAQFEAEADFRAGVSASKEILLGRRFDAEGWHPIFDNRVPQFEIDGPVWQIEGTANLRAYVRPKLRLLVYSLAGVLGDLQPYAELQGRVQFNPFKAQLDLYAGLTSTIALDLRVWDEDWGELPSVTFDLIKPTLLAHRELSIEPPRIVQGPQSQTVATWSTATFQVQATGTAPLSYQWQRNGQNLADGARISGSGSSTLRISNVQSNDAGEYRVIVSNGAASATSSATLTVIEPPQIVQGPQSRTVAIGSTATFQVQATGTPPLNYQWHRNGQNLVEGGRISGSRTATLRISNAQSADEGEYRATVSNAAGSAATAAGTLTVRPPFTPTFIGRWPGYRRGPVNGVALKEGYAFVAIGPAGLGGLGVFDVSDPANPVWLGGVGTAYSAYSVQVVGSYAYLADEDAGLQIINVSNPANPVRVGGIDTTGFARNVHVVGSYAYVAGGAAGLHIINVSNPANPVRMGGIDPVAQAVGVVGVQVVGSYAYVADFDAGLQIINVSNPTKPVRVGGIDTAGDAHNVQVVGSYAYVADLPVCTSSM